MHSNPRTLDSGATSQRMLAWWLVGLAAAFALDGPIARLCQPIALVVKHSETAEELKEGGHFFFVLFLATFIWILHPQRLRGALLLCGGGVISGIFYSVLKWIVGRPRPVLSIDPLHFEPFSRGFTGLFHGHNLAFPSGHACLAFATAACLSHLLPRGRWAFFLCASFVALERVAELAHYFSDSVAGAAMGILAFHIAIRLFDSIDGRFGNWAASPTVS